MKTVVDTDTLHWYYHSYLRNTSNDILEIINKDNEKYKVGEFRSMHNFKIHTDSLIIICDSVINAQTNSEKYNIKVKIDNNVISYRTYSSSFKVDFENTLWANDSVRFTFSNENLQINDEFYTLDYYLNGKNSQFIIGRDFRIIDSITFDYQKDTLYTFFNEKPIVLIKE